MGAALLMVMLRIGHVRRAARLSLVEAEWEPLVLDVLAGDLAPPQLAARISAEELPFFAEFLGRFVRRLAGPERLRLQTLAQPVLPVLRRSLTSRSPERRAGALDSLGLLAPLTGADDLRAALDDPSPLVAMVAARALTRSGRADHADWLISRLHRFQEWRPSYLAAMLAAMGPAAVPALLAAFGDPQVPGRVRIVAADALARLNAAVAADTAAGVVAAAGEAELSAAALRLLARVGHGIHLPVVRASLRSGAEGVRLAAARALAALGDARERPLLLQALDDPSRWVAEQAARGLLALGGRSHLEALASGPTPRAMMAREVLAGEGP